MWCEGSELESEGSPEEVSSPEEQKKGLPVMVEGVVKNRHPSAGLGVAAFSLPHSTREEEVREESFHGLWALASGLCCSCIQTEPRPCIA